MKDECKTCEHRHTCANAKPSCYRPKHYEWPWWPWWPRWVPFDGTQWLPATDDAAVKITWGSF